MIATSTLELGIDVGSVDLMIQVASPISVSSGLQRLGRAGHRLNAVSKGRIIPKTRGDLLRSAFISKEMLEGNIEKEKIPLNCLDILAQHIVSMSCDGQWTESEMLEVIQSALSYKDLKESDFRRVLAMLAGDFEHQEDIPAKPRISWDRQNKTIEGTAYSRMLAVNSSGTIPDRGYFAVYLEDYKTRIGELDEVFVFEARLGDRFMLGNSAWKIQNIEKNRVIVSPGSSIGAKTPFWQGDGIGGPYEQGLSFGRFLKTLTEKLDSEEFIPFLTSSSLLDETAAINIRNYLSDQLEIMGCLSHDKRIVVEYFRDNEADQKIIIHAHFGGRVNSVLAIIIQKALEDTLRCQAFASNSNDAVLVHIYGCPDQLSNVLSLLKSINVESVLLQMLPLTSRFAMTFRYNAYRSLMMGVRNLGQRLPLWLQRLRSVDALENARKFMDHPLLIETMRECLEEIFDIPNTIKVLSDIKSGNIEVVEKNTYFPSPFASELLFEFKSLMMYAEQAPHPVNVNESVVSGIDALALSYHRDDTVNPLNPKAVLEITRKNSASQKLSEIASINELHSFMLIYGDITHDEVPAGQTTGWMDLLMQQNRALFFEGTSGYPGMYIAAEESDLYKSASGVISIEYDETLQESDSADVWTEEEAINRIIRRYSRYRSPFTSEDIKDRYRFDHKKIERALNKIKSEGMLISGHFLKSGCDELCHVKVYEAIIRRESALNANEVVARDASDYAAFLPMWQKAGTDTVSPEASLYNTIRQMEGLYLPMEYWETIVFPSRIKGYAPSLLDRMCASGKVFWRLLPQKQDKKPSLAWYCIENFSPDMESSPISADELDENSEKVLLALKSKGACFTHVLTAFCGIPSSELLDILENLVYKGFVVNDSFISLRYFINKPAIKSSSVLAERDTVLKAKRVASAVSKIDMGRWEIAWQVKDDDIQKHIDRWLARYGLLSREVFSFEESSVSWNDVYEALKLREYSGSLLRGYFLKGISGIQFMLPEAWQKLEGQSGMQVINACDPSQVYGKILPHSESTIDFTNIPGSVVIMDSGKPVLVLERYGENISFSGNLTQVSNAAQAFKEAFDKKRIWPDRKKVIVKYWPEDKDLRELLQSALSSAGFKSEIMKMILYRNG
jgi:ATP-dependent Lhr-like helicase